MVSKLIHWKKEYIIGIKELDVAHHRVIDVINELYDILEKKHEKEMCNQTINKLLEESKNAYSLAKKHISNIENKDSKKYLKKHEDFIKKISKLNENSNKVETCMNIIDFLEDWFFENVVTSDRKLIKDLYN